MFGKTKDPVCGMKVSKKYARVRTGYQGKMYYFCSVQCKDNFENEPERWLSKPQKHEHHAGGCCH